MKKKIVVAEDDPSLQEIFSILLGKKGYEVRILLREEMYSDHSLLHADLFLLDLQLWGSSGLDICRELKMNDTTSGIPVIMISANPNIHLLAEKCGANASIEKPFDTQQLLRTIAFHLDKDSDLILTA
jgi:DNA-binding response OmpR family regulator